MAWNPFRKPAPATATPVTRRPADIPVVNGIIDPPPASLDVEPPVAETEVTPVVEPEPVVEAEAAPEVETESAPEVETSPEPEIREAHTLEATRQTSQPRDAAPAPRAAAGPSAAAIMAARADADDEDERVPDAPAEPVPDVSAEPVPDAPAASGATTTADEQKSAEQERLERERQARREARLAALNSPANDQADAEAARSASKAVTERFWGSLGLFVLRAVTAVTLFVHGLNGVIDNVPLQTQWGNTVVPASRFVALGLPWLELGAALLLFFGLLTRFAGLITALVMAATLVFVLWGRWSIFEPGNPGFLGEHELLLAASGLTVMLLGAGAWSLDYLTTRSRTS